METVYVSIGSNVDAEQNLRIAAAELRRRFGAVALSGTYRNTAVGFEGDDFLNLVAAFESAQSPAEIQKQIEEIHDMTGRQRGNEKFAARPLDIDLLLYGDRVIDDPPIKIPRTDVLEYAFVLGPLAELVPDLVHPETGRTMSEHWRDFDGESHPLSPVNLDL